MKDIRSAIADQMYEGVRSIVVSDKELATVACVPWLVSQSTWQPIKINETEMKIYNWSLLKASNVLDGLAFITTVIKVENRKVVRSPSSKVQQCQAVRRYVQHEWLTGGKDVTTKGQEARIEYEYIQPVMPPTAMQSASICNIVDGSFVLNPVLQQAPFKPGVKSNTGLSLTFKFMDMSTSVYKGRVAAQNKVESMRDELIKDVVATSGITDGYIEVMMIGFISSGGIFVGAKRKSGDPDDKRNIGNTPVYITCPRFAVYVRQSSASAEACDEAARISKVKKRAITQFAIHRTTPEQVEAKNLYLAQTHVMRVLATEVETQEYEQANIQLEFVSETQPPVESFDDISSSVPDLDDEIVKGGRTLC